MTKISIVSLATLAVVSVLAAPTANARPSNTCAETQNGNDIVEGRGKASPGLICQVDYEDRRLNWGYTNADQICNFEKTASLIVHCPLLRTVLDTDKGLNCASATLVHQQGAPAVPGSASCAEDPGSEYSCILRSMDESGWTGWWFGWQTMQANGQAILQPKGNNVYGNDWRAFMPFSFTVDKEYHHGSSYYMSCELPGVGSCGGQTCVSSLKWFEAAP